MRSSLSKYLLTLSVLQASDSPVMFNKEIFRAKVIILLLKFVSFDSREFVLLF